jgi:hypothetical protein
MTDTDWHFVAYTYDGQTFTSFMDGRVVQRTNVDLTLWWDGTADLVIAGPNPVGYNHNCFTGYIDEVLLFNKALSEAELRGMYRMGSP